MTARPETLNPPQTAAGQSLGALPCSSFTVGQDVSWRYVPRGGWGFPVYVPARILKINPKTIRIKAKRKDGEWEARNVKPQSLRKVKANNEATG